MRLCCQKPFIFHNGPLKHRFSVFSFNFKLGRFNNTAAIHHHRHGFFDVLSARPLGKRLDLAEELECLIFSLFACRIAHLEFDGLTHQDDGMLKLWAKHLYWVNQVFSVGFVGFRWLKLLDVAVLGFLWQKFKNAFRSKVNGLLLFQVALLLRDFEDLLVDWAFDEGLKFVKFRVEQLKLLL